MKKIIHILNGLGNVVYLPFSPYLLATSFMALLFPGFGGRKGINLYEAFILVHAHYDRPSRISECLNPVLRLHFFPHCQAPSSILLDRPQISQPGPIPSGDLGGLVLLRCY